ncbi:MAG TPA: DNA-processing protein DprA [Lentimicrobium sp.]|nr:DNA-processing protein DprA [Lentimicrobium sp.]
MSTTTANQLIYSIALTLLPGIGHVNARKLIAHTGSPEALFQEKKSALKKIDRIGDYVANSVANAKEYLERAEQEISFIEKNGIKARFFTDEGFPSRLNQCADGPILIYTKGTADLNSQYIVSMVGTRRATDYGKEMCKMLIDGLSALNIMIVSGLAYGIDTAAHKYALDYSLPTVGVLAHGLDRIYPPANHQLAERMLEKGGLVTEFMSKNDPDRENFPMRNRIIAGLADATIVVEAGSKGGALITADIANSYNRDVFAVPGKVSDAYSEGCNNLIKTNRAALLQKAEDIFYIMGWDKNPIKKEPIQQKLFVQLEPDEELIVEYLQKNGECSIDSLCLDTSLSTGKVATALLNLECVGLIKSLPGKIYKMAR